MKVYSIENLILNYANYIKSEEYNNQDKFNFAKQNKGMFDDFEDFPEKIITLGEPDFIPEFIKAKGMSHMLVCHILKLLESFMTLFDKDYSLETRIIEFRKLIQNKLLNDESWNDKTLADPGIETASYILFINDYNSNLLFTETASFDNFAKMFNLKNLLDVKNEEQLYIKWQDYCKYTLIPKMNETLKCDNTMLDAEDFIMFGNEISNKKI